MTGRPRFLIHISRHSDADGILSVPRPLMKMPGTRPAPSPVPISPPGQLSSVKTGLKRPRNRPPVLCCNMGGIWRESWRLYWHNLHKWAVIVKYIRWVTDWGIGYMVWACPHKLRFYGNTLPTRFLQASPTRFYWLFNIQEWLMRSDWFRVSLTNENYFYESRSFTS